MSDSEFDWLTDVPTNSDEVKGYYDRWSGDYDETLKRWNYQSPQVAAGLMREYAASDTAILDVGCGTGLTGKALHEAGFGQITGVDISAESLQQANQTNAYTQLHKHNLQQVAWPFAGDDAFDALNCIGVMTYLPDTEPIMREFVRVVRTGGVAIFSQRDDTSAERGYDATIAKLESEGLWRLRHKSKPLPYLPNLASYANKILVIYYVCEIV